MLKSSSLFACDFSIPQNCFGRCLSISGSWNYMSALLSLQVCTKLYRADSVRACFLPYRFLIVLKVRLDSEHFLLYQGARCLSHLLGLVNMRRGLETDTTSALVASASRNASMLVSRASLDSAGSSIIVQNAAANSGVDECSAQVLAVAL